MVQLRRKHNVKTLFKKVKLLALDVDGVLTRGEIIYDSDGRDIKIFNVKDGLGVSLLGKVGIKTVIVTAKDSPVVHRRAKDMGVVEVIAEILPKEKNLTFLEKKYNVNRENICFVGDDLLDLGLIELVGVGVTVADASQDIKNAAKYITRKNGGEGAVREVVDLIIDAQGLGKSIINLLKNP